MDILIAGKLYIIPKELENELAVAAGLSLRDTSQTILVKYIETDTTENVVIIDTKTQEYCYLSNDEIKQIIPDVSTLYLVVPSYNIVSGDTEFSAATFVNGTKYSVKFKNGTLTITTPFSEKKEASNGLRDRRLQKEKETNKAPSSTPSSSSSYNPRLNFKLTGRLYFCPELNSVLALDFISGASCLVTNQMCLDRYGKNVQEIFTSIESLHLHPDSVEKTLPEKCTIHITDMRIAYPSYAKEHSVPQKINVTVFKNKIYVVQNEFKENDTTEWSIALYNKRDEQGQALLNKIKNDYKMENSLLLYFLTENKSNFILALNGCLGKYINVTEIEAKYFLKSSSDISTLFPTSRVIFTPDILPNGMEKFSCILEMGRDAVSTCPYSAQDIENDVCWFWGSYLSGGLIYGSDTAAANNI